MTEASVANNPSRNASACERRVLLCVAGLSPQIITETLYALAVAEGDKPWIPTEVHVITTLTGAQQARLALLAPDRDQFGRLCRDYGLPPIAFDESSFTIIEGPDGQPLADIMTPGDNEASGDAILRVVARYAADPTCAIHASIAGGRKTMGFFLGYAMSLCGRPQDRLSHVLCSEGFEGHPQFFYPPPNPATLQDRSGREMSTADARVMLAEIPFVPLRNGLPVALQDGRAGYTQAVRAYQPASSDEALEIAAREGTVHWRGQSFELTPTQMAIYVWLSERVVRPKGTCVITGVDSDLAGIKRELAAVVKLHMGEGSLAMAAVERMRKHVNSFDSFTDWIRPHRTRINKKVETLFGRAGLEEIGIQAKGASKRQMVFLGAPPTRIRLV